MGIIAVSNEVAATTLGPEPIFLDATDSGLVLFGGGVDVWHDHAGAVDEFFRWDSGRPRNPIRPVAVPAGTAGVMNGQRALRFGPSVGADSFGSGNQQLRASQGPVNAATYAEGALRILAVVQLAGVNPHGYASSFFGVQTQGDMVDGVTTGHYVVLGPTSSGAGVVFTHGSQNYVQATNSFQQVYTFGGSGGSTLNNGVPHLVEVYRLTTGRVHLFIDGVLVSNIPSFPSFTLDDNPWPLAPWELGAVLAKPSNFAGTFGFGSFDGWMGGFWVLRSAAAVGGGQLDYIRNYSKTVLGTP